MKIDIYGAPPPLVIGGGENQFSLRLKRFGGEDRLAICDACAPFSFGAIQAACARLVIGWENVSDAGGTPIAFDVEEEHGKLSNRFDALMGALPLRVQGQVIAAIVALVGLAREAEVIRKAFENTTGPIDLDPISPPAATMPSPAAGGSPGCAT